jgi:hypothetical protein
MRAHAVPLGGLEITSEMTLCEICDSQKLTKPADCSFIGIELDEDDLNRDCID